MLQDIRDRAQGWIAWVIVILITIPFALWGVHEYLGGSPNVPVAEVNGVELTARQFRQAYRRQETHLRNLFGPDFDGGLLDERVLKRSILRDLIDGEVLLQAGIDNGLRIGDRQLGEAIQSRSIFQEEGRFSEAIYQRWLRMFGYSAGGFEQEYRRSLLIDQIERAIADTAFADTQDVRNILRLQRQKRRVSLLRIPRARYASHEITEEAIRDYHERNRARFLTPERVSVHYLELSLDDLPDVPEPAEEELRGLYEHREANHAEVGNPQSDTGPNANRPFEQVRGELLEDFQRQQKAQLFFETAEQLANLTFENPDTLAVAADTLGLTIEETGLFDGTGALIHDASDKTLNETPESSPSSPPRPDESALTKDPKFIAAAFSEGVLEVGENSEPMELGEYRVIVLRRKEYLPASPRPLEAVREEVMARLDTERAQEKVIQLGNQLIEALRGGAALASVAHEHGLTVGEPMEIGRDDPDEAVEIVDKVFRMPPPESDATVYDGLVTSTGDFTVIGLEKVIEKEITDADTALVTATRHRLARTYGHEEYRAYIRALRANAEIRIHEKNL
uniref:Peptidyl-prolyl cis-trans isomerase D n=1 Tax=Candidatus Kentrum eta TaxID=2126337 RepID=A0A450U6T5_9GAMM|nr:MAG: peptidyl-prolyl cis-trans isomerase D [Candidatus Kentron sp. H]VFJ88975.1 MAG: peptidyl-prolyl cis-trans isomerase D [Candidatus Kentron sp. H]VFJ95714.1 MAG: peptidyl-prolyl cis-trans isomerase D [Candidatus Kentron sp. H]